MTTEQEAFVLGFNKAEILSPREAIQDLEEQGLPSDSAHVTCYLNGAEDGYEGDCFRVVKILDIPPKVNS